VVARPLVGSSGRLDRALEARHDVAREELVGPQGLLPRRPLVSAEEQAAEAAAALALQVLDALHDGVDRAEGRGAARRDLGPGIGKCGSVYGARGRRAWRSSNQSVFIVTGSSQRRSCMIASSASSMRGRCVTGSMPSM